jgi:hypothetical protein
MGAIDNVQGTVILKAMLAQAALVTPFMATSPIKLGLGSTTPTATAAMTQLPTGTGYTTNGLSITFSTVVNMATTGGTAALTWTNTAVTAWSIVGAELWDSAGTPLRWFYGVWNGQPIPVAQSNSFQLAIGGASVSLS